MTPQQVIDQARNNLNALSDTLWSDSELLTDLYIVSLDLARETRCIENTSTQSCSTGTQEYSAPSTAIDIWRVTYDGSKLQYIDLRHEDMLNYNTASAPQGTPRFYSVYDSVMRLYPTPDTGGLVLKTYSYDEPVVLTATATIPIPTVYHDVLVAGVTYQMCPKDLGHPLTNFWQQKYFLLRGEMKQHIRRKRRGDRFNVVLREEDTPNSNFGPI